MYQRILAAIGLLALAGLAAAPTSNVFSTQSWHDQERIIQTGLISLATLALLLDSWRHSPAQPSLRTSSLVAAVLLLAVASSCLAHQPLWAFIEVSLFTGCVAIAFASLMLRRLFTTRFDRLLFAAMTFVIACICLKFLLGYASAQIFHLPLHPMALLDGFNNLRYLGQFQTLSLPLLALPLLLKESSRRLKAAFFVLLVFWWVTTITGGTRACFMALGGSALIMLFMGPLARRWCYIQAASLALATLLFYSLMFWLPPLLGNPSQIADERFFSTTLSMRDTLWRIAILMIDTYPWLGIGPMHYADQTILTVAHPHNSILQWAAEWGLPSLILVMALLAPLAVALCRSTYASRHRQDHDAALRICLLAALIGAAAQSMVDGVTVMPYTQTWLAIIAGWIWALQPAASTTGKSTVLGRASVMAALMLAICSSSLLGYVAWRDYSTLAALNIPNTPPRPGKGVDPPRYWLQGSIANPDLPGSYGYKK